MINKDLKTIRLEKNFSHNDVATLAGISRSFYTMIENGNRVPSFKVANRISTALGISLDDFFNALEVTKRNPKSTA